MGIGVSIFSFALGAILAFAVRSSPKGFSVPTVGVVLMIVGIIGFATSLYIERNRRHLIEESITHDSASTPPLEYDDQVFVEPEIAPAPQHAPRTLASDRDTAFEDEPAIGSRDTRPIEHDDGRM